MPAKGQFKDLSGKEFGYLTVIRFNKVRKWGERDWECVCRCGNILIVLGNSLKQGLTKSCGCYKKEWMDKYKFERLTTHGMSDTPEYGVWAGIHKRCSNKKVRQYKDYGGRGITVCTEWKEFENFIRDMGLRPSPRHTIERLNNSKGYSKSNCIWATYKQQSRNTRRSIYIVVNGKKITLVEAVENSRVKYATALYRYHKGYSVDEILK